MWRWHLFFSDIYLHSASLLLPRIAPCNPWSSTGHAPGQNRGRRGYPSHEDDLRRWQARPGGLPHQIYSPSSYGRCLVRKINAFCLMPRKSWVREKTIDSAKCLCFCCDNTWYERTHCDLDRTHDLTWFDKIGSIENTYEKSERPTLTCEVNTVTSASHELKSKVSASSHLLILTWHCFEIEPKAAFFNYRLHPLLMMYKLFN